MKVGAIQLPSLAPKTHKTKSLDRATCQSYHPPPIQQSCKLQLEKRVRTMKVLLSAVLAVTFLMLTVPAQAHHSFNTFWHMDRNLEIEGVVKSFKLVSPHSEMMVEVTEPDGAIVLWRITAKTGAINAKKQGWKPEDFIGKKVKVAGNPPRRDGAKSMAADQE